MFLSFNPAQAAKFSGLQRSSAPKFSGEEDIYGGKNEERKSNELIGEKHPPHWVKMKLTGNTELDAFKIELQNFAEKYLLDGKTMVQVESKDE